MMDWWSFSNYVKKTVKSLHIGDSSKITGEGVDGIEVRHVSLRLFCLSISIFVLIYLSLNKKCVFMANAWYSPRMLIVTPQKPLCFTVVSKERLS